MRKVAGFLIACATVLVGSGEAGSSALRSAQAIVFERDGDLFAVSLDGDRTVRLTNTRVWWETSPAVSPDGRWIAYSKQRGHVGRTTIWIRSIDGRVQRRLTPGWDSHPTWSPDGRTIYFSRSLDQVAKGPNYSLNEPCGAIFRIDADGRDPTLVTNPPWKDSFHSHLAPAVSPDGSRIVFTDANQCSGGTTSVVLRMIDRTGRPTGELARLRGNRYYDRIPHGEYGAAAWSPDGRRIVFASSARGFSLATARRDGTDFRWLTPKGVGSDPWGDGPAWSLDGQWIAFIDYSDKRGNADLCVIHPD